MLTNKIKKLINKILSCTIAVLLIFQLSACSNHNSLNATKEEDKMKGTLSVYYVDYTEQAPDNDYTYSLTLLLQDLQNEYTDVEIVPTTFVNNEAFMTQVSTELASGNGPDLFLLDYATEMNWIKMGKASVYENLSPYMKNDKSFDIKNYFEPVIKAGQVNDKQYIIPLGYNFMSLHTSKQKLKENNININTVRSYEDILSALSLSVDLANNNSQITPLALSLDRNDFLSCFMEAFGMEFIDYQNNEPNIDKTSLKNICDFLKKYYPYSQIAFSQKYENSFTSQNAKNVIFTISNREYIGELTIQNAMMKQLNDESISIPMPKYDDSDQATAQIFYYAAVNGNSENKQLAYDTAKALMDLASEKNIDYKIPVNRNNFDDWMSDLEVSPMNVTIDNNLIAGDFDTDKVKNIINNIQYVSLNDFAIINIVNDGMMPYIESARSFDECYEETVNKLNLYINE